MVSFAKFLFGRLVVGSLEKDNTGREEEYKWEKKSSKLRYDGDDGLFAYCKWTVACGLFLENTSVAPSKERAVQMLI